MACVGHPERSLLRVRVKICGITNVQDALLAVEQGADAIGLVFYAPSARYVNIAQAIEIVRHIPAFVSVVALFLNAEEAYVNEVIAKVKPDLLQFHGDEAPSECERYSTPYIKAIPVQLDTNLVQYASTFFSAKALLLDTYVEGMAGGTGKVFDWNLIPKNLNMPVILAGGLNADNVAKAITQVNPYAVDVSGGVELSKGIKDAEKIAAFMRQVYKSK